ncbi:ribonuclease E inhibitor RraB [Foetidibacter luteolus]|uniref:ribonuclease E inhibitor RraB n=1 Tax=Foetidibacter luteolus TaxID=2608880 RepID=UPI00129AC714|nr:ribonuclease E inhibitor RraB [Foetidibacter luteolus]
MKTTTLTLILTLSFFSSCQSQTQATQNPNDLEQINSIFDRIEVQGVDTKQNLLYGYFFFDKDKSKLEKLKTDLVAQSYRFVELGKKENVEYMLHVEKIEKHTRQSLQKREEDLRVLAGKHNISSFNGFDVGNADPTKPLVSNEGFARFMATKNGNDLFDLGIKLYDLEINDKAELVFRECLKQSVKPDTSAYKLGNTLINENRVQEGINHLVQATNYNPNYLSAFFNLGATCYDNGQFQKSIDYYHQADKLKPNDDRIIYGMAASQYAIQQYDKSLANCKKALQLNKDNDNAKQLLQMLNGKTK